MALNLEELKTSWKLEEQQGFEGWDFSGLNGRMGEEPLPWDYRKVVLALMQAETVMLDMGTGGGEFLLSLNPPPGQTYATEAYLPNFELCRKKLPEYGIDVRLVHDDNDLPFKDGMFDLVINRHESFSAGEVFRLLKPGGVLVTQQVGGQNNRELSRFLLGGDRMVTDAEFDLNRTARLLEEAGFTVTERREYYPELRFHDIGALVRFARIIEWEFPDFSVDRCFEPLCRLQGQLAERGYITSREHRFFITAHK
ncbi:MULTISPECIES: class I SAM-dependent methyltransferase [Paenibacillus]|uniref:class I SAM-dependent methyltransferase n=1 Tax=Paenibacillus TaxID=44249 RepID=UPI002FDF7499